MKNKIYYLLATQDTNMGDLLINKMLVDEIAKYGDVYIDCEGINKRFTNFVFEKDNVYSANEYIGASLKRISFLKALFQTKKFDYFFRTPGPNGRVTNYKSFLVLTYFSFLLTAMKFQKVKLFHVGTDFATGNIFEILNGRYNTKVLSGCYVRSKQDTIQVTSRGFKNVNYIPDMAFLYRPEKIKYEKNKILVSFRVLDDVGYKNKIIQFLDENLPILIGRGYNIVFFSQVESDKAFNNFLYERYKREHVSLKSECIWYDQIQELYNTARYTISNRLHVLLLGMVWEAIPIGILNSDSKTSKIFKIFSSFGMGEIFLNPIDFDGFEKQYEELRRKIIDVNNENHKICQQTIKEIFS